MTKYKATQFRYAGQFIEEVEVVRETSSSVYLPAISNPDAKHALRRRAKRGQRESYFDTWTEAKAWLVERAERNVELARASLQHANNRLGNVKGLKPHDRVACSELK